MTKEELKIYLQDLCDKHDKLLVIRPAGNNGDENILMLHKEKQCLAYNNLHIRYYNSSFVLSSLYDQKSFDIKYVLVGEDGKDKYGLMQLEKMKQTIESRLKM